MQRYLVVTFLAITLFCCSSSKIIRPGTVKSDLRSISYLTPIFTNDANETDINRVERYLPYLQKTVDSLLIERSGNYHLTHKIDLSISESVKSHIIAEFGKLSKNKSLDEVTIPSELLSGISQDKQNVMILLLVPKSGLRYDFYPAITHTDIHVAIYNTKEEVFIWYNAGKTEHKINQGHQKMVVDAFDKILSF